MKPRREILILTLLLFSASAFAQTVRTWVSTTGNDANPCSKASPCRNLAAGIAAVSPGGEVVVSDSGGYGSVTVTTAVSIISPPGLHAAIAPTAGTAVTVNGGVNDVVVLRGLYLNSQGATAGIEFLAGKGLHLENLVVNGFSEGVNSNAATGLFVKDSLLRNNSDTGISVHGGFASIDRARIESSPVGVYSLQDANVTVRDSAAAGNQSAFIAFGLNTLFSARLNIENCMVSNNEAGIQAGSFGIVMVSNSIVSGNQTGLRTTSPNSVLRVTGSTISANLIGMESNSTSILASFGNNAFAGNDTDGDFTATIPLQ